jgi:hypothetical protein
MATFLPLAEWKSVPQILVVNYSALAETPGKFKVSIQVQNTNEIGRSIEGDAMQTTVLMSGEVMEIDEAKARAEQLAETQGVEHIVMWDTTRPPAQANGFGRPRFRRSH